MEKGGLILCDTNVIIEFYKGNQSILDALKSIGQENIVVSVVTSSELLYGALNKAELNKIKKDLSNLTVLPIEPPTCQVFTDLMTAYSLSHNLTLPDALIAATAIANDLPLYTLNKKDFKFIEGLKTV